MIGSLNTQEKKVHIVGAGISGLLIGYHLKKQGYEVQLYEASSRAGGLIETKTTPYGIAETAAHSLLVTPSVEAFFKELNLELIPVQKTSKARYIVRNGKLRRIPLSTLEILSTLKHLFSKPKPGSLKPDLSVDEWGKTYLGAAATQYLLSPFVSGIYACSPLELNASLAFPTMVPVPQQQSLFHWLRENKKKNPGKPRAEMKTLRHGLQSLVNSLHEHLKDDIHFNHPIDDISSLDGNVILTIPTNALAKLIEKQDPASSETLGKITYSPLITTTAFYRSCDFQKAPPKGVGALIPRSEKFRILGCLFNSSAFSNRVSSSDLVSLTVMLGGTSDPDAVSLSDQEIKSLVDAEVRLLLGSTTPPLHLEITRWKQAIPVFSSQLKMAQNSLKSGFCSKPGKIVFSNYSESVSVRSLIENIM